MNETPDSKLPSMYCGHANECPSVCECPDNCLCKDLMCQTQTKKQEIPRPPSERPSYGPEDFGGSDFDSGFESGWERNSRLETAWAKYEDDVRDYQNSRIAHQPMQIDNQFIAKTPEKNHIVDSAQPMPIVNNLTRKLRDRNRKLQRRLDGLCVACGVKRNNNRKSLCDLCFDVSNKKILKKRDDRDVSGKCRKCDNNKIGNIKHCEKHWLIGMSVYHFNTVELVGQLKNKLIMQNYKCYYTGLNLIPGINASIDHMEAESIRPDLKTDINNIVWCDKRINEMKTNFSVDEFLALCQLISSRSKIAKSGSLPGVRAQRKPVDVFGMPEILDLVKSDLEARTEQGIKTYGTSLKPFNGRDSLIDAYHEMLDLAQYIRQEIFQRDGK